MPAVEVRALSVASRRFVRHSHKGSRGWDIFGLELLLSLAISVLPDASTSAVCLLSPLAAQEPSPWNTSHPSICTGQRVAITECEPRVAVPQHTPGKVNLSVFVFDDVQGILVFSSARNIEWLRNVFFQPVFRLRPFLDTRSMRLNLRCPSGDSPLHTESIRYIPPTTNRWPAQ